MIDRNGTAKQRTRRACVGPLASHIKGFVASLLRDGYAPKTVKEKCELIVDLSRWMERCKLPLMRLDERQLTKFRIRRHRGRRLQRGDMWTARQLLRYLQDLDCIPTPQEKKDRTLLGQLTRDFERYLNSERGLSRSTLVDYLQVVRRFLIDRFGSKAARVKALRPSDIHQFLIGHLNAGSRSQAKGMVTALRSFLRFLHQRGVIATDLAAAVPAVADWRLSQLPKSLPPKQVNQLLASCDRTTAKGQRDYAMLLLIARLGLRASEVVRMTLDDLDWERGEIVVHGKGQQEAKLPLPTDVGAALVNYLRHVRPACSTRRVFIRMKAPQQGLKGNEAVGSMVRSVLKRAGLNPESKGSHLLRHSLATNLLRRGATLSEIGQLLRHKALATTQIYAKVDIAALRTIALPWPRGAL
jgi:integrase/recombinase XerD